MQSSATTGGVKRRALLASLASLFGARVPAAAAPPPVRISVGAGNAVRVTFQRMNREQLAQIVAVVMTPAEQTALASQLAKASSLTLVMTTTEAQ
jgi:hypothetical protein